MITFFVPGVPVPKGSAKGFYNKHLGRVMIVQTNADKQKPWASMIAVYAQQAMQNYEGQYKGMFVGPVSLACTFQMPRPKAHSNSKGLKPNAPSHHTSKPDLDKLLRCILDALTAVVYEDDSQVAFVNCAKLYASRPGVTITVKLAEA